MDEKSPDIKKILRRAAMIPDISKMLESKSPREAQLLIRSRAIARQLKLDMKMAEVEVQTDNRKATAFILPTTGLTFVNSLKYMLPNSRLKWRCGRSAPRQR